MAHRRPGSGDDRWNQDALGDLGSHHMGEAYDEYGGELSPRARQQQRGSRDDELNSSRERLYEDHPAARSPGGMYGMASHQPSPPRTPPRTTITSTAAQRLSPSPRRETDFNEYRRGSTPRESDVAGSPFANQYMEAEVARARVSADSSSYPSSSETDELAAAGSSSHLKDDHNDPYGFGVNGEFAYLQAIQEGGINSAGAHRLAPNTHKPEPYRAKARPAPSTTMEPSMPPREVSRRYRNGNEKRQPDLCRGELNTQDVKDDEHVVPCSGCHRGLKVKKTSILVRCPNCTQVGSTVPTEASFMR